MLIVWFGPASAHISHFCEGFSIALAFYFRHQSTSKRWKFTVALSLLWHNTLTTFSHELAHPRLDWCHAYIMMSCVRIPPHLCATLAPPLLPLTHLTPPCSPSCTLLPLAPPHAPYTSLLPLMHLTPPCSPTKKKGRKPPTILLLNFQFSMTFHDQNWFSRIFRPGFWNIEIPWLSRFSRDPYEPWLFLNECAQNVAGNETVFIYDGAPAHRGAESPAEEISLRMLRPYSPFLNIVENAISAIFHNLRIQEKSLMAAAEQHMDTLTIRKCNAWFRHMQTYLCLNGNFIEG